MSPIPGIAFHTVAPTRAFPMATGKEWMVVATHPLAAQVGGRVLASGGSAAEAGVAVAAAIGVVEPWYSGLGGSAWILYYSAREKKVAAIDAAGVAPLRATPEFFNANGGLPNDGILSPAIPGSLAGWLLLLERYGSRSFGELLAPAVELAEKGFPVSTEFAENSRTAVQLIQKFPDSARVFLKEGRPYRQGEILVQTNLANSFKRLQAAEQRAASGGRLAGLRAVRETFYRGPIAAAIAAFSRREGGILSEEDFARYEAAWAEPITIDYRGYEVYECPPASQGIVLLQALQILEGYDLKGWGAMHPEAVHVAVEALKLAMADREHFIGDPKMVDVPVASLLSRDHAEAQRKRITPDRALAWPLPKVALPPSGHTTVIVAADREGNLLSVTTSLGNHWLVAGETGIVLNNRLRMFHLDDGHPNQIAPGKRIRFTANPALLVKDGKPFLAIASPGVDVQPQAQLQGILNVIDFGMTIQEAVAAPRWVSTAFPDTARFPHRARNALMLEPSVPPELKAALQAKGHQVEPIQGYAGNLVGILVDQESRIYQGGADPRREATAIGW
jgi:gamma-glutamyltranspeptidase/glutathione hydrolase